MMEVTTDGQLKSSPPTSPSLEGLGQTSPSHKSRIIVTSAGQIVSEGGVQFTDGTFLTLTSEALGQMTNGSISLATSDGNTPVISTGLSTSHSPTKTTTTTQLTHSNRSNSMSKGGGKSPTCRVCGDESSGFHYGVDSCEGCKGFFRRCITQGMTHKCSNEEKCEITPFTRNSCQYCRLKKCFAVGMSREASRLGRRPKRLKDSSGESKHSSGNLPIAPYPSPAELYKLKMAELQRLLQQNGTFKSELMQAFLSAAQVSFREHQRHSNDNHNKNNKSTTQPESGYSSMSSPSNSSKSHSPVSDMSATQRNNMNQNKNIDTKDILNEDLPDNFLISQEANLLRQDNRPQTDQHGTIQIKTEPDLDNNSTTTSPMTSTGSLSGGASPLIMPDNMLSMGQFSPDDLSQGMMKMMAPDIMKSVSPEMMQMMSPEMMQMMTPEVMQMMSPEVMQMMSPEMMKMMTPDMMKMMTPEMMKMMTPEMMQMMTPEMMQMMTPEMMKMMTPEMMQMITPEMMKMMTPEMMKMMTPEMMQIMTPDMMKMMTPEMMQMMTPDMMKVMTPEVMMMMDNGNSGIVPTELSEPDPNANVIDIERVMEEVRQVPSDMRRQLMEQVLSNVTEAHFKTCHATYQSVRDANEKHRQRVSSGNMPDMSMLSISPQTMWQMFIKNMLPEITCVVQFCKKLPGFGEISQKDQIILIKKGTFEVLSCRMLIMVDVDNQEMFTPDLKMKCSRSVVKGMLLGAFMEELFTLAGKFNPLMLTEGEIGLFSAVLMMCPEREGINNKLAVEKLNVLFSQSLYMTLKQNHSDYDSKFARLISMIPHFRQVNQQHSMALNNIKMERPDAVEKFPDLHKEVFDLAE